MKVWQRRVGMLKATPAPRLHPSFCCCRLRRRDNPPNYSRIHNYATDATRRDRWHFWLWSIPVIPPLIGRENPQLDQLQCYERSSRSLSCTQLKGSENKPAGKRINSWQEETYPSVTQTHCVHTVATHKRDSKTAHKVLGSSRCSILSPRLWSFSPRTVEWRSAASDALRSPTHCLSSGTPWSRKDKEM